MLNEEIGDLFISDRQRCSYLGQILAIFLESSDFFVISIDS